MPTQALAAPTLDNAYTDGGKPGARVVLLLHGWPDDASIWDGAAPALHAAGLRTIAPMLRGFGGTRRRVPDAPRRPQRRAGAQDRLVGHPFSGADK